MQTGSGSWETWAFGSALLPGNSVTLGSWALVSSSVLKGLSWVPPGAPPLLTFLYHEYVGEGRMAVLDLYS